MGSEASSIMPVVVLYEPQNPINIGAVARACLNCDVHSLRLVSPRVWDEREMLRTAPHGAQFIEENITTFDTWEEAIDGIEFAYGFTSRGRAERQKRYRLKDLVTEQPDLSTTAFVFGREDFGLPNEIIDRCQGYVTLETSETYASLNLAQAVMVSLYYCFSTLGEPVEMATSSREFDRITLDSMERLMQQVESSLDTIDFFNGNQRHNVLRTVRRVLLNADMDRQELATVWGVFSQVEKYVARFGSRDVDAAD